MDLEHFKQRLALLAIGLVFSSCSAARPWLNPPLTSPAAARYDGLAQVLDPSRLREVLVVANFSGGGSRSAAFAYAVVSELDARPFSWRGRPTTLARELDLVTGVSGGGVVAAHMALHGLRDHLAHFPEHFLRVNFQRQLVHAFLLSFGRSISPFFGRGHVLVRQLDSELYHGATFGDLARLSERPYLVLASTDLSSGAEFDFTAEQLALLCSSIDQVPLAFAVAASSAVPAVFSPLTLASHGEDCSGAQPEAPVELDRPEGRPFLHLVDGGVADDHGARRIGNFVTRVGGIGALVRLLHQQGVAAPRRIVFLSVNSERRGSPAIDQTARVPGTVEVINTMLYNGLGRQSKEAALALHRRVEQWRAELAADPELAGADIELFDIDIKLESLGDPELEARVLNIPTAFRISAADFQLLRQAAAAALTSSADFQRFLASTPAAPAAP